MDREKGGRCHELDITALENLPALFLRIRCTNGRTNVRKDQQTKQVLLVGAVEYKMVIDGLGRWLSN